MKESTRTVWTETARRGKAHAILFLDAVMELYRRGEFALAHGTSWSPKNYRQFDNARGFSISDAESYKQLLETATGDNCKKLIAYGREYEKRIRQTRKFASGLGKLEASKLSNRQLRFLLTEWFRMCRRQWCFAYDYIFLNQFLPDIVTSQVAAKESDFGKLMKNLGVLFEVSKPSETRLEKRALLELAREIKLKKVTKPAIDRAVRHHLSRFAHLGYYYFRGSAYSKEDIHRRLKEYTGMSGKKFQQMIRDFQMQADNRRLTGKAVKLLGLDQPTPKAILAIKFWGYLSNFADETYAYLVHRMMPIFLEACRRLEISFHLFYSLTFSEVDECLRSGLIPASLRRQAEARHRGHAFVLERGRKFILTGKPLAAYYRRERKIVKVKPVKEIRGQPASPGKVAGRARLVFSTHDLPRVERGDIIISSSTNPTFVPAMERAGAIVTDEGGLLSHAAIVSRELKIPCVVGTKIATKVLKDGMVVEVDANLGLIKIVR